MDKILIKKLFDTKQLHKHQKSNEKTKERSFCVSQIWHQKLVPTVLAREA